MGKRKKESIHKLAADDKRDLAKLNSEIKKMGRHSVRSDNFKQMERLYSILADMGVDPKSNGLGATPGQQGVDELVDFLRIPTDALMPPRFWSAIESYLRRWAGELPTSRRRTAAQAPKRLEKTKARNTKLIARAAELVKSGYSKQSAINRSLSTEFKIDPKTAERIRTKEK